jgi:hypothetical protein
LSCPRRTTSVRMPHAYYIPKRATMNLHQSMNLESVILFFVELMFFKHYTTFDCCVPTAVFLKVDSAEYLVAEPEEVCALLKEALESSVYVLERLLQELGAHISQLERHRPVTLERGQLRTELLRRAASDVLGVVAHASLKFPVVYEPPCSSHAVQTGLLGLRRAYSELVDFAEPHLTMSSAFQLVYGT